ncbi:hypothetical protein DK28_0208740 [Peptococcaceae bacterium SCADC1_2_3]|jgi:predicted nucleotidyltransferase|nr:hypothetical protein DK28_0208740 [Peptococcaceae bacterium SCADC1_2_3]KFI35585.1 hypothetical protein HY00_03580 [Peptococcaceae bacterium SCADC1_2_3]
MKLIKPEEHLAIAEFKQKIIDKFGRAEVTIFGSKARGNENVYSDIDLLVLLEGEVNNSIEEEIFDLGFEVELKYDVILGIVIYSKKFWNSSGKLLPLYNNISREGIIVQ